jgi:poly(3-hydroxybutyrate) depolymerase
MHYPIIIPQRDEKATMKRYIFVILLIGICSTTAHAIWPVGVPGPAGLCGNLEFESCSLNVSGVDRNYCIHIPAQPPSDLPVIFAFHGGNQRADHQVEVWDKHTEQGIVIVAPEALESESLLPDGTITCMRKWRTIGGGVANWADFPTASTCPPAIANEKRADLDFIQELAQGIGNNLHVSRFYASGFSSGAGMIYQMVITNPFAQQFSGFAAISNTINDSQKTAALGGGGGGYTANTDTAKPLIFVMGTADKLNAPVESIYENDCVRHFTTNCTATGVEFDCTEVVKQAAYCWKESPIWGNPHKLMTHRADNIAWFVNRNHNNSNPIISLYPNLGSYGSVGEENNVDRTMAVRQDFLPTGDNSAPFTAITIIDGGHVHPGKDGDYPPCVNCDIDVTEQILQFWRAKAGFRSQWK